MVRAFCITSARSMIPIGSASMNWIWSSGRSDVSISPAACIGMTLIVTVAFRFSGSPLSAAVTVTVPAVVPAVNTPFASTLPIAACFSGMVNSIFSAAISFFPESVSCTLCPGWSPSFGTSAAFSVSLPAASRYVTVRVSCAVLPEPSCAAALMTALPGFTSVTSPFSSTRATDVALLVHFTSSSASAGYVAAASCITGCAYISTAIVPVTAAPSSVSSTLVVFGRMRTVLVSVSPSLAVAVTVTVCSLSTAFAVSTPEEDREAYTSSPAASDHVASALAFFGIFQSVKVSFFPLTR